jgi:hypothetical protein
LGISTISSLTFIPDPATAAIIAAGTRTEVWFGFRTDPIYQRMHQRINELWRSARDD